MGVNVEHIIIDGNSTDGTSEIIQSRLHENIIYLRESDNGIYSALNKGLKMATGDIVGILHSDDLFYDSNILNCIQSEFLNPRINVVYGDLDYVSKLNTSKIVRKWKSGTFNINKLIFGWMPPHPTLFIRTDFAKTVGMYNEYYSISSDYDYILRCFSNKDVSAQYICKTLVKMRVGGVSNRSIGKIIEKMIQDYKIIRSNNTGGIITIALKNLTKVTQFVTKR